MPHIHIMILQCKQYQLILGTLLMANIFVKANAQWDGLEFCSLLDDLNFRTTELGRVFLHKWPGGSLYFHPTGNSKCLIFAWGCCYCNSSQSLCWIQQHHDYELVPRCWENCQGALNNSVCGDKYTQGGFTNSEPSMKQAFYSIRLLGSKPILFSGVSHGHGSLCGKVCCDINQFGETMAFDKGGLLGQISQKNFKWP